MTKGQMKEVLEKVETLEKILMRELDEQEIEYLKDHSVNEFIYDVLEFDKEDLLVLLKIKKIISDWCTRPEEEFNTEDDIDLFKEVDESLISEADINLFKATPHKVNNKVANLLTTIITEFNDSVKPRRVVRVTSAEKAKALQDDAAYNFSDENEITEEDCGPEISEEDAGSVLDIVPENAKKWVKDLSVQEITDAMKSATEILIDDYLKKHPNIGTVYTKDFQINDDEMMSEVVDQIKDAAVRHYIQFLKDKCELELDDDEIRSEVLDYLYKHNYKVKTINNKISLV